ncbi:solute carrier family member 5 [Stylonychia lemnae]|uniref:Solute carrier family member 5 n=1 Tax=Stylonychia lemnae TaxID=5949 RepID=A0A078AYL2_STYLE|nr:solute carrier family member 5 [Stylonychia lemnae]|eukprot:CDW87221.1 solute carrier family member 5 [Stylonychia lemnae]
MYNISYFIAYPDFQCFNQEQQAWVQCSREQACNMSKQQWKAILKNGIYNWIEELDLYCSPKFQISLLGSLFFAGLIISMAFLVPFADVYGRKPFIIFDAIGSTLVQLGFLIFQDLTIYYILMFVLGALAAINIGICFAYNIEIVEKKHEVLVISLNSLGMGLAGLFVPLYFIFIGKTWQPIIYAATLASMISTLMVFNIKESPRFLSAKLKNFEAMQAITEIARFNNKDLKESQILQEISDYLTPKLQEKLPLKEKIHYPNYIRNIIIMAFIWTVSSFNFCLMNFYMSNMQGDINMNNLQQSIGLLISYVVSAPIINKLGIKASASLFFFLCCLAAVLYSCVEEKSKMFISAIVFIGRFGICPTYTLAYMCSNALFPPEIQSTSIAICNIVARSINLTAPFVAVLSDPLPFHAFGILSVFCWIAIMALDLESKNEKENLTTVPQKDTEIQT